MANGSSSTSAAKTSNSSPRRTVIASVIDFADALGDAKRWPDLLAIVREKANRHSHKNHWWRFGEVRPAVRTAIRGLRRCLVTARVSKHLSFSFQPTNRVIDENVVVFPLDRFAQFAVMQSRLHVCGAGRYRTEGRSEVQRL